MSASAAGATGATAKRAASARRLLAPEVIQTSAMDCGPASLKCLLEGFGIPVSYGRLREACQTDVDGTSIDTLQDVAGQLGLAVEQTMLPADHLLLPEAEALPALAVVRTPDGDTHFVVVWRRVGPLVQLMDPAVGRRWVRADTFARDLYIHSLPIPTELWHGWARTDGFTRPLAARLGALGLTADVARTLVERAAADERWRAVAALDAATRMTADLVAAGGVRRGTDAGRLVETLATEAVPNAEGAESVIPTRYWSVRSASDGEDSAPRVTLTGAVLIRVTGRRAADASAPPLSHELETALREPPPRPARELWRLVRADGLRTPLLLVAALALVAAGTFAEAILFRGLLDLGRELGLARQRFVAVAVVVAFLALLLLAERSILGGVFRAGRRLEARLRVAFLEKLPRLGDRYFQSRPISDMAERSHSLHRLRQLPPLGAQVVRVACELLLTTAGLVWLDPSAAPIALAASAIALGWPLLAQPALAERDLRMRTHTGALGRFYLDALLGLTAIRTHGAERPVRGEHEGLLVEWARAGLRLNRTVVGVEAGQLMLGFALAALLLQRHMTRGAEAGTALLIAYWALQVPVLGQEAGALLRQYPLLRTATLRLLEPLGTPDDSADRRLNHSLTGGTGGTGQEQRCNWSSPVPPVETNQRAVDVRLEQVEVRAGGHTILHRVDLHVPAGQHVAVVGRSGAGKSTLVGLLLGWHRPAAGEVRVDGVPLGGARLERLREETAWLDPSVHLWNASVFENLVYAGGRTHELPDALDAADVQRILETMPDGLQTPLGESGRRVSGGEGQRIRFGRALLRSDARLVLLDEPFRGLDGARRGELLDRARTHWRDATLLCVTHDIEDTRAFERVLVVENGAIVEDGAPDALLDRPASRYRTLLEQERDVRREMWNDSTWRRLRLADGTLGESDVNVARPSARRDAAVARA